MGVHGLWELLAPVGRRVSVETLAGKKLAIDASIWMIQFMKAMRDEKGEMVRNAHVLGFFRRICKLLYLRTKPVFVFDGGTPALKRRTVIARRRQRENAQAKLRKTAEKLLLNHLKAMRLKELAADLEKQRQENDIKGKRPITQEPNHVQHSMKGNDGMGVSYDQEELDAMLAASLAVEESGDLRPDASTSGGGAPSDEDFGDEEEDEDEEMILPEMHGKVDPAVLAALPPSMQLDLLVQMRERLMAENRQKYQKVKKAPARFSELQIQAYLKTVAFRREIDGVQKAAAGRGIGGVQTSRIASEANREFIFSSSFTGDKQALTSVGQERVGADESQPPQVNCITNAVNEVLSTKRSSDAAAPTAVEAGKSFNDDVETYLDERGRRRVSRGRALGIRMTRDLQRNLDLMKEFDQEKADTNQEINNGSSPARDPVNVLDNSSDRIQHQEVVNKNNDGTNDGLDKIKEPAVLNGTSIEVSFEDTLDHEHYDDDKLFASLVAEDPIMDFSVDNSASVKQSLHSSSDCEWEEGVIEDKNTAKGGMSDEGKVEWEEGSQDIQLKSSSCPDVRQKDVTEGALQEQVNFREAIRRSLEDTRDHRLMNDEEEVEWDEGFQDTQMKSPTCLDASQKAVTKGALQEEADLREAIRRSLEDAKDHISPNDSHEDDMSERARQTFSSTNILLTNCSVANSAAIMELNPDESNVNLLNGDAGGSGALPGERPVASDSVPEEKGLYITGDTTSEDGNGHAVDKLAGASNVEVMYNEGLCVTGEQPIDNTIEDGNGHAVKKLLAPSSIEEKLDDYSCPTANIGKISANDSVTKVDGAKEFAKENISNSCAMEKLEPSSKSSFVVVDDNTEHEITKDHLEKKMLSLDKIREELEKEQQELERNAESVSSEMFTECQVDGKEHELREYHLEKEMRSLDEVREALGSEQLKLERNAESVSSEMFVECQELLQMFGLPYIIAPMEAEAQCAFMELSNLVDGVVTDDSDAFLFGARSVYKNIFDDRKYVETYLMKDIEDELGLDREKLIHMALLLGSDYTEGISGIGIVNAIEVVNAFPEKDGLHEFREWIESPDPSILGKLDVEGGGNMRRKGSKDSETIMNGSSSSREGISSDQNVPHPVDDVKRKKQTFMDKHRNVSKNWHIPSTFPSDAVISAYASPQVDKSTEPFSWGKPDLFVLRKLCWDKFGWSASKADELLLPVLKEYSKHETQLRLEAFYTFNERFAKIRSKRIKKAVKGITGHKSSELIDEATPQNSGSGKKRKLKPSEDEASQSGLGSSNPDDAGTSNKKNNKPAAKQLKRGLTKEKTSVINLEQTTGADGHLMTRKESHVRGRKRGQGRGQVSGKGKRKKSSSRADTETSNDDGSCNESDKEMQFDQSEESHQVRRSERVRRTVNYTVPDELNDSDENMVSCTKEDLATKDSFLDQEAGEFNKTNGDELNEAADGGMGDELPSHETEQEHKMENTSPKQIGDSINQCQISQDYLQFGGGFCLDDDDDIKEFDGHASSSHKKETIPDKPNLPHSTVSMVEEDRETDLSDTENDPGISFSRSLRPMPNLRKKNRKT